MSDNTDEFRALFECAPDLVYTQDLSGRITRVNRGFERITGLSREAALKTTIQDLNAPEQAELFRAHLLAKLGGATSEPFEIDWLVGGARVPLELSLEVFFDAGAPAILAIGRDITAKRREQSQRAAAEQLLQRQTLELATFSRYVQLLHRLSTSTFTNPDGLFRDYLKIGCEIFGVSCGAVFEGQENVHPVKRTCSHVPEFAAAAAVQVLRTRATVVVLPGQVSPAFYAAAPLITNDNFRGVLAFWSENGAATHPQAREIIEMMARGVVSALNQRQLTEKLEQLAKHDVLTGLPNRMLLTERIEAALKQARADDQPIGVLFLDLDHFKQTNDTFGHAAGDHVLQQVARRLESAASPQCSLARLGGDEFAGVISGIGNRKEALDVGHRILQSLTAPVYLNGSLVSVSASAGVSMFPDDGTDGDTLLRKADAAMYRAKLSRDSHLHQLPD